MCVALSIVKYTYSSVWITINSSLDGSLVYPQIANPECENSPGCGTWVRPLIRNPDYKGKWKAPKIDNPEYKGKWAPRKIEVLICSM